jgi:alanyl-tRNA synthetase
MFTDKYGEEVRLVSIGQQIDSMLQNPKQGYGYNFSVEFCGGTHVQKTSEIFKLVILSEEPISKGVRRIVACSGQQAAAQAGLKLKELSFELDEVRGMTGKLLDDKSSEIRQRIKEDAQLSLVERRRMENEANALKQKAVDGLKEQAKKLLGEAKKEAEAYEAGETDGNGIVFRPKVNLMADMKAAGACLETLTKKYSDKPVCVIAPGDDKVAVLTQVPKKGSTVDAKAWLLKVLDLCDGKGGGNNVKAQGTGSKVGEIEALENVAKQFLGA